MSDDQDDYYNSKSKAESVTTAAFCFIACLILAVIAAIHAAVQ